MQLTYLAPVMDEEKVKEAGVGKEEVEVQIITLHLKFKNLFSKKPPAAPETQEISPSRLFDKFNSRKIIIEMPSKE